MWITDHARGQDDWILAKFFFVCLWTEAEWTFIKTKNELGQFTVILTEQAWSKKDLLYAFGGDVSCGTGRVVPKG